jgi:hypothetical protein
MYELAVDTAITNIAQFASAQSSNYKMIKQCNPWLRQNWLPDQPKKVYYLEIPAEGERILK